MTTHLVAGVKHAVAVRVALGDVLKDGVVAGDQVDKPELAIFIRDHGLDCLTQRVWHMGQDEVVDDSTFFRAVLNVDNSQFVDGKTSKTVSFRVEHGRCFVGRESVHHLAVEQAGENRFLRRP